MIESWKKEMAADVDWSSLADTQKQELKIFVVKTLPEDWRRKPAVFVTAAANRVISDVYPGADNKPKRQAILDSVMRLLSAEKFQGMIESWKSKMARDVDWTSLADTQKQELKDLFKDFFKATKEDQRKVAGSVIAEVFPGAKMEGIRELILGIVMNLFSSAGGGN
jgi:hypothetical protein